MMNSLKLRELCYDIYLKIFSKTYFCFLGFVSFVLCAMSLHVKNISNVCRQFKKTVRFSAYSSRNISSVLAYKHQYCRHQEIVPKFPVNNRLHQQWFHVSQPFFESVTVNCPAFAESISEGDVRWDKAVGDSVKEDDTVAEIETDKTSIPIPSPSAGVIEALLVEDGTTVTPGTPLFKINTEGSAASAPAAEKPKEDKPVETASSPSPAEEKEESEPPKIPESMPPPTPVPTTPLSTIKVSDIKVTPFSQSESTVSASTAGTRSEHRVKMNRMRLRIAQRLKDSQNTAAMLTTFNEVDMSNIMAMRSKYKESFLKKHGLKLSFMSAFIKASAYGLKVYYCYDFGFCLIID